MVKNVGGRGGGRGDGGTMYFKQVVPKSAEGRVIKLRFVPFPKVKVN